jgi:DNA polymerase V
MAIGLIDANNYYAAVERAFDPALRGRPLVVVGNNDGIIVARSPDYVELKVKGPLTIEMIQSAEV